MGGLIDTFGGGIIGGLMDELTDPVDGGIWASELMTGSIGKY